MSWFFNLYHFNLLVWCFRVLVCCCVVESFSLVCFLSDISPPGSLIDGASPKVLSAVVTPNTTPGLILSIMERLSV